MRLASLLILTLAAALATGDATAQTVRFQTSVGAFDMLLNPTGNPDLQPLVDNMLANVAGGVYHSSVVNRAPDGFVLQIGSFQTDSVNVSEIPFFGFDSTDNFDPIEVDSNNDGQVDFDTTGLSNTRGTVSLALSAGNANSGSASFFINIGDNSFLDAQGFVTFAEIADMTTVDRIMSQQIVDLSNDVQQPGSLAYTDVPLADDGDLIVIETAGVVSSSSFSFAGPLRTAFGVADPGSPASSTASASSFDTSALTADNGSVDLGERVYTQPIEEGAAGAVALPEPTAALLLLSGTLLAAARRR